MTIEDQFDSLVAAGENVFLTGAGGTGKTTLTRRMIARDPGRFAVTASTGIAALNAGGFTLHRWSGMMLGPRDGQSNDSYLTDLINDPRRSVRKGFERIRSCQSLVIDEISMLNGRTLDFLDFMCRQLRQSDAPFGGIQVIATGDFLQLPPVNKTGNYDWAFQSRAWKEANFRTVHLIEVKRQDDVEFVRSLSEFRFGVIGTTSANLLRTRIARFPDADLTRLFTHNVQVDKWNAYRLGEIESEPTVFDAELTGPESQQQFLINNLLTPRELILKPGAHVMFTVNSSEGGFVNGQTGVVADLGSRRILVESNGRLIQVEPFTWQFDSKDKTSATFTQFPLRLSWAMTIHKCVAADSMIPTEHGIIPARKVEVGQMIHTGAGGYERCLAIACNKGRPMVRVHTAQGYSLRCTPEHPVFAVRAGANGPEFIAAESLGTGDHVCLSTETQEGPSNEVPLALSFSKRERPIRIDALDTRLAHLLGLLVANASYRTGDTVFISNPPNEALEMALETLDAMGINVRTRPQQSSMCAHVHFSSSPFFRLLAMIGMDRVNAGWKRVPEAIWRSPLLVRGAFIRGLFDGDGSASGNSAVRLVTTSPALADDVQRLLLGMGIVAYKANDLYKQEIHHSPASIVCISGSYLAPFHKQIGFTVRHKQAGLKAMVDKHNGKTSMDFIPHGRHIRDEVLQAFAAVRSRGIKGSGIKANRDRCVESILKRYKNLSRSNLQKLVAALNKQGIALPKTLEKELARPFFYAPVTWIEPEQPGDVLDFEIENAHCFNANGFICHNCQGLTLDSALIDVRAAREPGQAYVAASRLRTLSGLHLKGWFSGIYVSRTAVDFYLHTK